MKGARQKISKLLLALKQKGRIILISNRQFYSKKLDKICTCYEITEQSERKKEIKNKLKELRKNKKKNKDDIIELEEKIRKEGYIMQKIEIFGKVDVLLFLANLYKEVKANEET